MVRFAVSFAVKPAIPLKEKRPKPLLASLETPLTYSEVPVERSGIFRSCRFPSDRLRAQLRTGLFAEDRCHAQMNAVIVVRFAVRYSM